MTELSEDEQQVEQSQAALSRTDICGDFAQFFSTLNEPVLPSPHVHGPTHHVLPTLGRFVTDLARRPIKGRVNHWWLTDGQSEALALAPEGLIGKVIRTRHGKTNAIALIDPTTRRIQTASGSVYELGMPEAVFAAKGRLILRQLGF